MKKIFSKEQFIKVEGKKEYNKNRRWIESCDGKEVINGVICSDVDGRKFLIEDNWCVEEIEKNEINKDAKDELEEMLNKAKSMFENELKRLTSRGPSPDLKIEITRTHCSMQGDMPSILTGLGAFVHTLKYKGGISEEKILHAVRMGLLSPDELCGKRKEEKKK